MIASGGLLPHRYDDFGDQLTTFEHSADQIC